VMVLEYCAASALETVRTLADPSSRHTTNISISTEDHAPFASRSVAATYEMIDAAETVVACELLTALRALRGARDVSIGSALAEVRDLCGSLGADTMDRQLIDDVIVARTMLDTVANVYSARL